MKTKILLIGSLTVALFFLLPVPEEQASENNTTTDVEKAQPYNGDFIISKVRLYDGFEVFEETDVLIKNNKIAKINAQLENTDELPVLEAQGKTLIPGMIDAHTHTYGDALNEALNFGVTTELDMFSMPEFTQTQQPLRDSIDNTNNADLFSSTILATTTNGHGTEYGFDIPVLNHVDEVEEFVIQRIADGADYIKAVYNSEKATRKMFPSISFEVMTELVNSAHRNNRMLVVHVDNLISAKEAINAGADGIVHSFMDSVVDDEFIQSMVENEAFVIPTLSVLAAAAQLSNSDKLLENSKFTEYLSKQQKQQINAKFPNFGIPESAFNKAKTSVSLLSKAGVTILAGTDAPNPGTTHGASIHGELMFLVEAGLNEQQALHSATGAASSHFDIGSRGTLKVGALASMVLLDGNPLLDIKQSQNILQIWKNGINLDRASSPITANTNEVIASGLISDFNAGISETKYGYGIFETTDKMAGGNSKVELSQRKHDDSDNSYLNVKGEILKGFMYRWSGFSFIPAKDQTKAVNLSQLKHIVFDAKSNSDNQELAIFLFNKGSYQPDLQVLNLTTEWQSHVVDLSKFPVADLTEITNISFVVSQQLGEFEFMIDNIELK